MKILQIIQRPQLRGAEIFACQLSEHLIRAGHDVILVSLFPGDAQLPFSGKHINLNRTQKTRFYDLKGWKQLARIIAQEQPDLVQANAGDTLKYAVFSKILCNWNVKLVFRNANKMGDFIDTKAKYYINKYFLKKTDYVISVSKNCEVDLIKTFDFPKNKICTIPIGVEVNTIPQKDVINIDAFPILINVASLVPEKNHIGLIKIFKKVKLQHPNAKLFIVGEGKQRSTILDYLEVNGLEESILLLGSRRDVLNLMMNSHIFVLPSLIEGLPGVILEAMVCKTPVVAYNVGGVSEIVKSGETGWLIEKDSEDGFVAAISEAMLNAEQTKLIVNNAFDRINSEFSNSEVSSKFLSVYLSLLSLKTQGRNSLSL